MLTIGIMSWISNCSIGLICIVVCRHAPQRKLSFPVPAEALIEPSAGHDSRGAHHVEHARGKAEQQKYNQPPRRDAEPAVDEPAEAGADRHACNEFAREPEALGVAGCSRRPIFASVVGCLFGALARQTLAEPLESRGESSFAGLLLVVLAVIARVAHASDTRGSQRSRHARPLKPRGPY